MSFENSFTVDSLTKKLKNEDPAQFQTLVRMHLSFVLDLNSDETDGPAGKGKPWPLKWSFVPFSKKIRGPSKGAVEGVPLTKHVINQIYQLIEFLTKEENVSQEGIFRRSGKMTRQQELKSLLTQGAKFNLEDGSFSVHDVATVLKGFLAELPEPLLTEAYYPAYCQIADLYQNKNFSEIKLSRSLQLLFMLLPNENRRILKAILKLLFVTASHVGTNRMSAENLATLFTPHLLCPRKLTPEVFHTTAQNLSCIVVFMIKEGLKVFDVPQSLATDVKAYWDSKNCNLLEKSISEGPTAKTVFTFVDRERTAKENNVNPTETALAQLYAHIQGLPESSKKKKLIKQFNKENGQGTPRTKSLGDSIKKHIFCKNQSAKLKYLAEFASLKNGVCSSDEQLNSPEKKNQPRTPLSYKLRLNLGSCGEEKQKRSPSYGEESSENTPTTPPCEGSDDNSTESKTSCSPLRLELVPHQPFGLDDKKLVMGSPTGDGGSLKDSPDKFEWGARTGGVFDLPVSGLPVQPQCPDSQSSGSEFLIEDRRFRPVVFRRRGRRRREGPVRVPPVLPGRREPTILDNEFWIPPQERSV
ncbi:rho GTPase-activating protein 19-like isoform X1 [Cimex lectularius]|uniref:Rho-GAP domain-containing protein n=1 Tax=Cimex lectularius TaxID=79782 RepID=A0A8I6SFM4_CIMLE|nr:rho GTPase-activating protein 19-like isoform X1 [Cimex lectularius]